MNRRQFEEIRRWGDKLRSDEREELRAAGEAIRMLSEEIERIGRELVAARQAAEPADSEFPGLQKAMKPADYEAAGLGKLDAGERAKLDEFIRNYVAKSNERVATEAVDKAVKERKVSPPEIIQSRIVGPFTSYNGHTIFTLENGQRWAQAQRDSAYYPKIDSPPVLIAKTGWGYRMYIAGGGAIRYVRRDGRNSEAGLDGLECVRPPGNHGDLCAFGHKRFNQAQTKAATSTSDDCALIFETHVLCSNICEAKTIDG